MKSTTSMKDDFKRRGIKLHCRWCHIPKRFVSIGYDDYMQWFVDECGHYRCISHW